MRKKHLTQETAKLIAAKTFHRQCLGKLRRHRRMAVLRHIFTSWRHQQDSHPDLQPWLRACDRQEAHHLAAFQTLAPHVVQAVRQDDKDFYNQLAEQAGQESQKGARQLWQAIRFALPKWRTKQKSNLRCVGPTVSDKVHHYNELEAGQTTSYVDLLFSCWRAQQTAMHDAPFQIPLQEFPTRVAVESLCAKLQRNKAPGIDDVKPDTLRRYGATIATEVTSLFLKMWTTGAEPVQWKGGLIHTIGKKKQSNQIKDMRGIALLDSLGKLSHAVLRAQFMPALQVARAPLQLGGFAHQSTMFATHYLRAFEQLASARKLTSCVVFLDIKSAFHSMVREVLFDMQMPLPERLREVLIAAGCDPDEVTRHCSSSEFADLMTPTLTRLMRDAHSHTWFTLASSDEVHHTHRGSRPGSPLADAAYNALMTAVLRDIQAILDVHPVLCQANQLCGLKPGIVAWVDDLALPLVVPSADALMPVIQNLMPEIDAVCRGYGLVLKLQRHKTEAVLAFRGAHAAQQRRSCFGTQQGVLCMTLPQGSLRCVPRYEHLGTIFTAEGAIDAEVTHRVGRATHAYQQVRRPILNNRHLSAATRLRLLEGLVMPVLFHGSGNWPLLSHRQLRKMQGVCMTWIRSILQNGYWTADLLADQRLLMLWRIPSVTLRLAKMRLLYAFHLVRDCPGAILDVVTAVESHSQSWIPGLRHALTWLQQMDARAVPWDPMLATVSDIFSWLTANQDAGPRLVRRLYQRSLRQGMVVAQVVRAHWQLRSCIDRAPHDDQVISIQQSRDQFSHECRLCAKAFATWHQLQVHLWMQHEVISDERRLMTSTVCDACHKCFWTAQRLQQHLRYSRRHVNGCYEQLTWRCPAFLSAPDIESIPVVDRFHRHPAMIVDNVPTQQEMQIATRQEADRILACRWREEDLPEEIDSDFQKMIFAALDGILLAHAHSRLDDVDQILFQMLSVADGSSQGQSHGAVGELALCLWIRDHVRFSRFLGLPVAVFQQVESALQSIMADSHVGQLVSWKKRMDEAFQPMNVKEDKTMPPLTPLEPIVNPCNLQNCLLDDVFTHKFVFPQTFKVPLCRVGDRTVILILHLFSGRRRIGDCHWWMQHLAAKIFPEMPVVMVSVDTAIDSVYGDLSCGSNFGRVLGMTKRGAVAGSLTGPPCETFSAARGIQLDTSFGPRLLRTSEMPWCLHDRSDRELRQCATGAELLLNSLQLECSVVVAGGGTIMEHPAEPNDSDKVSVWRLRCHREWCMKLPSAVIHRIEQWLFGAVGVKPTFLRAINLGPPVVVGRELLYGAETWRTRPQQGLKGRGNDGRFRTARAKEYPSALCRSMVVALLRGLRYRWKAEGTHKPVDLLAEEAQWLTHMCAQSDILTRTDFLPDYQGT